MGDLLKPLYLTCLVSVNHCMYSSNRNLAENLQPGKIVDILTIASFNQSDFWFIFFPPSPCVCL